MVSQADHRNKTATLKMMRKPDSSQGVRCYFGIDQAMYGFLRGPQVGAVAPWPAELTHPSAVQAAERAGIDCTLL